MFMQTGLESMVPQNATLTERQRLLFEPPSRMHSGWFPDQ